MALRFLGTRAKQDFVGLRAAPLLLFAAPISALLPFRQKTPQGEAGGQEGREVPLQASEGFSPTDKRLRWPELRIHLCKREAGTRCRQSGAIGLSRGV